MEDVVTPSLQDFSLVKTRVDQLTEAFDLSEPSLGFYYFVLDLILNLQDDEIEDAITDTAYLAKTSNSKGHDRGIDAVYIDDSETSPVVHLFSCKYTDVFKKTQAHFPSSEIDKICGFLAALMRQDEDAKDHVNPVLFTRMVEIWDLFRNQVPRFVVHICSNLYYPFEESEKKRFERQISIYSGFDIYYHLITDFVLLLTRQGKQTVNARIRAIDRNLFEKSGGDIRALIVDVETRDLLRIVIDDEDLRDNPEPDNYSDLQKCSILEDAFEDNVRIYLKQRSKINRNIKETALSDDSHRFFYYNNGITITCSSFQYPTGRRAPIIELWNLQIVNGSQTIHALFEAFSEDPDTFQDMDVLCRIYETHNEELSTAIAEYTNSQNPVTSRDIRSNDFVQKKLEKELEALGYLYERKKAMYRGQPKDKRIDAEKAGQALLAFFNQMPAEAKDKKRDVFAQLYDDIFTDQITADSVILAFQLFNEIERRKLVRKREILSDPSRYEQESFIVEATYYVMYVISKLADVRSIVKTRSQYEILISLYDEAVQLIRDAVDGELEHLAGYKETYTHRTFFRGNRPKQYLD